MFVVSAVSVVSVMSVFSASLDGPFTGALLGYRFPLGIPLRMGMGNSFRR